MDSHIDERVHQQVGHNAQLLAEGMTSPRPAGPIAVHAAKPHTYSPKNNLHDSDEK